MTAPLVSTHDGIYVVRDDLFAGGTKARFIGQFFAGHDEVVYASPAQGGAQTALATVAAALNKKATIFVADRAERHPRTLMAANLGASIHFVRPGYLNVVQARAAAYAQTTGALLAPFGIDVPAALETISQAAAGLGKHPADEIWCAAGSGVLARGLAKAWPLSVLHVVQVGRELSAADVAGATIHIYPRPFGAEAKFLPPFPSDPHYDAKAWEVCKEKRAREGRVLFWNVTGPAIC